MNVLVVGGGPAGLAAAIALRRRGMAVTVMDGARPPIDKACGEGLLPSSTSSLRRLGVSIPEGMGFPLRGIRFFNNGAEATAEFPKGQAGLGIRRTALHSLLVEKAEEAGVLLQWGAPVSTLDLPFDWIVGADGINSSVRLKAGLEEPVFHRRRFGFRRHYRIQPWSPYVEVHWRNGFQIYVTPVGGEEVSIAILTRAAQIDFAAAIAPLDHRLNGARICSAERGAVTSLRRLRSIQNGNVILLGDASGSVDAITGEGLGCAFQQAQALADSLMLAGSGEHYRNAHRGLFRRPILLSRLLLALDAHPIVRAAAIRGLAAAPPLFGQLLRTLSG
ncbi:MAG: FAD-dependent monooxygenase [Candidatus Solibacter usitatus]|nr:FAD-dependent monooxygenase [Candidatus Solibacter usitatus]